VSKLLNQIRTYLAIHEKSDPVDWIQRHVSLAKDPTSASDGYVHLDPYQIMPIRAQYQAEVREVTIMAIEQTGKSACWRFSLLHKAVEYPGPTWVIYESDDKASEINEEQFDPLLRSLPQLHGQINRKTALKYRYNLANGTTIDFSGAGADITSKPKRDGVADELDTWPLTSEGIEQNLRNYKKRFRTYWVRGEGCLVKVSSPSPRKKGENQDLTRSTIGTEFRGCSPGYAGYWTLRCKKCRELSMPSHAIHNLQWECDEAEDEDGAVETVKKSTLRLVCPKCGHEHREKDAQAMNDTGAYCTGKGEEITGYDARVGYQWGALACPRVFAWAWIAEEQMASGRTADVYAQANFDNSVRGLPFRPRRKHSPNIKSIKLHCSPRPDPEELANVFFSADTQDNGWYYVARGVDTKSNLYLLGYGFVRTVQELKKAWDAPYAGIQAVMGIIDEGGHGDMPKYVEELVEREKGLYSYKGGAIGERWRHSPNKSHLILANAKQYQADLLYYMYSQDDKTNNYWFLPPEDELEDEYLEHMAAMQKSNTKKHGQEYENWESGTLADHYFDCEKQLLVLLDVAYKELKKWRKPVGNLRRGTAKTKRRKAPALETL